MLGESAFHEFGINTFSGRGGKLPTFTPSFDLTPMHYVSPHWVSSYTRRDGTFVPGFWRDGDGNTSINRNTGYFARNPRR